MTNSESSALLIAMKSVQNVYLRWMTIGWLCVPICFLGCYCVTFADTPRSFYIKYKALVAFYGGRQNMINLNKRIQMELQIFARALGGDEGITLLDVIQDMNPRFRTCCDYSLLSQMFQNRNTVFSGIVWDKYISLGGNYHVIIYGLFEYLCMFNEPTSEYVDGFLEMFLIRNSVLKAEILSHKDAAGI